MSMNVLIWSCERKPFGLFTFVEFVIDQIGYGLHKWQGVCTRSFYFDEATFRRRQHQKPHDAVA